MRIAMYASLLSMAAMSAVAPAQNMIFGSLSGTLTDSGGAVIPGATVSLINQGTRRPAQRQHRRRADSISS